VAGVKLRAVVLLKEGCQLGLAFSGGTGEMNCEVGLSEGGEVGRAVSGTVMLGSPTPNNLMLAWTAATRSASSGGSGSVRPARLPDDSTSTDSTLPARPIAPPACRYSHSPPILRQPVCVYTRRDDTWPEVNCIAARV
jgi:hypothetical protein